MQFVTIIRYTFYSNSMFCSVNDGDLSVKGEKVQWYIGHLFVGYGKLLDWVNCLPFFHAHGVNRLIVAGS